ncbi:hypothetical protein N7454_004540 [Penicillium verhagenii]|nr:hypothetical protein N7454_004540 [Penicillium verhagenii]
MALNSWFDLNEQYTSLGSNMLMVQNRDVEVPKILKEIIEDVGQDRQEKKKCDKHLFWHERFQGSVSADKNYPYEPMQVDRTVQDFVDTVDLNIFGDDDYLTKKCQVLAKKVSSLGVFATRDINRGELLHHEEPTIRSHLQPRRMEKDETAVNDERRCENCMRKIDVGAATRFSIYAETKFERCPCFPVGKTAPGPDDWVFCRSAEQSRSKANDKNTEKSCLQIASKQHHFGSCGKDWSWLYNSMRPVIRKWQDREYIVQCNDMRGTMHSLLLRNIFEITLHRRKADPYLSPLEINELLILNASDSREDWFPFSYTGNVTVPFDILTYLSVDIFRDLSFDTWVIQSIMRKLLNYAIPWDEARRGEGPEILPADSFKGPREPEEQDMMLKANKSFKDHDPSFMNMYLFPGFSLFRKEVTGNASWGYDHDVPNRILVWAKNDIKEGEEIIIREPWCRNDTNQLCTEILTKEKRKMSTTETSGHTSKKRKTEHQAAEDPSMQSGRKRKAPTNDPEAAAQGSNKRKREEVKQFHPQKAAAKISAETVTKSTKRKRNEFIKSDGITLDFYQTPEDQDPPAGKKRRLAPVNKFRPQEDFQHEKWARELENMEAKRFESSEERKARIQRLKAERLVRYRQEQRERIDERDRRAGRPVRRRNPLCYDFT